MTTETTSPKDRRAETSPINGAKSHGPKTEDGKRKSSRNAVKHGLYSRDIVIGSESQQEYDAHKAHYLDKYVPTDPEEFDLVLDMCNARWLMRRVERHEKALFQIAFARCIKQAEDQFEDATVEVAEALAWQALSENKTFENLNRIALRYERSYYRAKNALADGRKATPQTVPALEEKPAPPVEPVTDSQGNEDAPPPSPPAQPEPPQRSKPNRRWLPTLWTVLAAVILLAAPHAVDVATTRRAPYANITNRQSR